MNEMGGLFVLCFYAIFSQIILSVEGFSHFNGATLTVTNRLTKGLLLVIPNVITNSKESIFKAQLHISKPDVKACSPVDPADTFHVHSMTTEQQSVRPACLLVEVEDGEMECSIESRVKFAIQAKYACLIFQSQRSVQDFTYIQNFPNYYVALISKVPIQSYAKSRYALQFDYEQTVWEKTVNYVNALTLEISNHLKSMSNFVTSVQNSLILRVKKVGMPLYNFVVFLIQVLALTSPVLFMIAMARNPKILDFTFGSQEERQGPNFTFYNENEFHDFFGTNNTNSNRTNNNNNENVHPPRSNIDTLDSYRKLLGVEKNATKSEIEREFRRKSVPYHPDKNMHLSEQERAEKAETFKDLSAAKIALLKYLEEST